MSLHISAVFNRLSSFVASQPSIWSKEEMIRFWEKSQQARVRVGLGVRNLVHINRKPCIGSPTAPSHVTLNDLERSRLLNFEVISSKRPELGTTCDCKTLIGTIYEELHNIIKYLALSDLERLHCKGKITVRFWSLVCCKWAGFGHNTRYVTGTTTSYMVSSLAPYSTWASSKGQCQSQFHFQW